jgi:hypothetical protein
MRAVRRIAVALLALALALGSAAAFAMMPVMQIELKTSAGAPDDGCHCCDAAPADAADVCTLKCCSAAAILTDAQPLTSVRAVAAADRDAAALSPFTRRPDLPPPRS